MSEKDIKIRISSDASGVRPGTQEAGRHIDDLTGKVNGLPDAYNKAAAATETFTNKGAALASAVGLVGVGLVAVGAAALAYAAHAAMAGVSTVKLANEMAALSDRTGLTVEHLSSMRFVLEQNNATVNDYAGGMKILSSRIYDAANGNKAALDTFQALGISQQFLRDNINNGDVVFMKLADRFSEMKDGAGKNALANDALGRSYEALLPTLNSGADGIRKLSEEGEKWGAISTDMAEKSRKLNDNWGALKFYAQGVGVDVANYFLPALVDITREARAAANESGLLAGAITALGVAFGKVFGLKSTRMEFAEGQANDLFKQVSEAQSALDKLASLKGKSTGKDPDWLAGEMDKAAARVANLKNELKSTITERDKLLSKPIDAPKTEAPYKPTKSSTEIDQYQKQLTSLLNTLENRADTVSQKFWQDLAMLDKAYQSGGLSLDRYRAAVEALIGKTEYAKNLKKEDAAALKLQEEGVKRLASEEKKRNEELVKSVEHDQAALEVMTRKNDLLEMGIESVSAMAVAELEAALSSLDYSTATYEVVDALEKRLDIAKQVEAQSRRGEHIKAMKDEAKEAQKAYEKTNDEINRGLTDALMRGWESGKGFAENFVDTVKNMFNTMVLRPIISAIVSPVSGMISSAMGSMGFAGQASAGTNYLGMASNGMSMNSLYQNGASYLTADAGIASGMTYGTNFGSQQSMMLAGQEAGMGSAANSLGAYGGAALGAYYGYQQHGIGGAAVYGTAGYVGGAALAGGMGAAAGGMAAAGTGAMAGATAALAAIPVWGWIALAALAIFGWDSNSVPKIEGNSFGILGEDGNVDIQRTGAAGAAPYGDGDWGRPGADFANVDAMVEPIGKGIGEYIKSMGGDATGIGFALGYNSDPGGDAPDNVMSSVRDKDGNAVYTHNYDVDRGKGAESLQKELPLMMLAAVQAADGLPSIISAIADSVNLLTASAEQADAAIAHINDANTVLGYGKADPLADFNEQVQLSSRSLMDVWNDSSTALNGLLASYDGSAAATKNLAAATQGQYQLELQMIQQIQGALANTQGMFGSSIESIKMSVMDDPTKYDYLRTQADGLYSQLSTATDPAQIQALADKINTDINAAYGMLDAGQKQGAAGGFVDYLTKVEDLTTQRLNASQDTITQSHVDMSAAITTAMDKAAADMAAAVAAAVAAAAAAAAAAPKAPIQIAFTSNVPGTTELGFGG